MGKTRLFAWAAPANNMRVLPDHTWVTSYDSIAESYKNISEVIKAEEHFWYCWGVFRPKIKQLRSIGEQSGEVADAICLAKSNISCVDEIPPRGTIFEYGVDGVCHQLANQVLYATRTDFQLPLTVKNARGYWASAFRYGTYGLRVTEWNKKLDTCGARKKLLSSQSKDEKAMTGNADEFESRVRRVLKDEDPKLIDELLALREKAQKLSFGVADSQPTAESLNNQNQEMLDRAAELLGQKNFERVFEFSPQKITLVQSTRASDQIVKVNVVSASMGVQARAARGHASVAAQHSMTKSQLIEKIADEIEVSKKEVRGVLETLTSVGYRELKKSGVFVVPGFAKFVVIKKPATKARKGTNPFTGQEMMFKAKPARKIVRARPVKAAKDRV